MIEVPAAALAAEQFAPEVDFFSLGTNDLTQYTMAAERGNASVAGLADGLHPSVLRLIGTVAEAASGHGKWAGVCGELASNRWPSPCSVGLEIAELSAKRAGNPGRQAGRPRHRLRGRARTGRARARALLCSRGTKASRRRRGGPVAEPGLVIARAAAPRSLLPALTLCAHPGRALRDGSDPGRPGPRLRVHGRRGRLRGRGLDRLRRRLSARGGGR